MQINVSKVVKVIERENVNCVNNTKIYGITNHNSKNCRRYVNLILKNWINKTNFDKLKFIFQHSKMY